MVGTGKCFSVTLIVRFRFHNRIMKLKERFFGISTKRWQMTKPSLRPMQLPLRIQEPFSFHLTHRFGLKGHHPSPSLMSLHCPLRIIFPRSWNFQLLVTRSPVSVYITIILTPEHAPLFLNISIDYANQLSAVCIFIITNTYDLSSMAIAF